MTLLDFRCCTSDLNPPTIFEKHPLVETIVAESVLDDALIDGYKSKPEVRRTYVLDMPDDFQVYRKSVISTQLRYDIEREERRMNESFPGMCFLVVRDAGITQERFLQAATLITSHLSRKEGNANTVGPQSTRQFDNYGASWRQYVESGAVATLETDGHIYAAALCLFYGKECYFMAAGHDELITRLSLGKILLFRLIEELIAKGISRLHLGGGNFGYKSRYGAVEHPLYSFEFLRPSSKSLQERIKMAVSRGERVPVIESDIGASLEVVLGSPLCQDSCRVY